MNRPFTPQQERDYIASLSDAEHTFDFAGAHGYEKIVIYVRV